MSKPKYFLYARKSTEDDDHQVMSIEAQLFELREFARKENLEILEEFQESKSAKKPGREKWGEMIKKIEESEGVGILSWHPDRLARNSVDGGKIIYLVDQEKIVSLRFPTFWFEPTPQGLFMLQVAFGQSKYYSDNLVENINRGIRQKIRRGEWLTLAPFGYVNNPKTRNIEPDAVKSKIIVRMFEEFAKGHHTFKSISDFLSDLGITSRNGTPLAKSAVQTILTNRAYLGLVNHKGEYYDGSFPPILSTQTFEAVQKVLERNAKPRKSKIKHNFPFTGLFSCGECNSAITAQWAIGRRGGKYRYYRCTKKKGNCTQGYLREDLLIAQLREQLQTFALCDECVDKMLERVNKWEKEADNSSQSFLQNLKDKQKENQRKLDKLVSLYLDGDIDRGLYLEKKETLMHEKVSLNSRKNDFERNGKNWVEPLRSWILDTKKASVLASSENYSEMKAFVQKIGTNPNLLDKTISFSVSPLWDFVASRKAETVLASSYENRIFCPHTAEGGESSILWSWVNDVITSLREVDDYFMFKIVADWE